MLSPKAKFAPNCEYRTPAVSEIYQVTLFHYNVSRPQIFQALKLSVSANMFKSSNKYLFSKLSLTSDSLHNVINTLPHMVFQQQPGAV